MTVIAAPAAPPAAATVSATATTPDADLKKLIQAWRKGDLRALEAQFVKERAKSPALYDALLGDRNRKWMPKIEALLGSDQDYLVVVGTLHYVGKDGLLALLEKRGFKPVPMPASPALPN
jgi:hypothetical protein